MPQQLQHKSKSMKLNIIKQFCYQKEDTNKKTYQRRILIRVLTSTVLFVIFLDNYKMLNDGMAKL